MKTFAQTALIVLDGWGHREDPEDNAVSAAKKPFFDKIWREYPHTLLEASGLHVGLPRGQMGNSEIGHTTIGAGTVIDTDLVRIKKSIESGEFARIPAFKKLFDHVKKNGSTLHAKGLIGNGGVHAHQDHLVAFVQAAKDAGIRQVAIHAYTDGRDTPPQSSAQFLRELESDLEKIGIGFIATATGRFYAMDRDNNWDRVKKAEEALFECKGNVCEPGEIPSEVISRLHAKGALDEHLEPVVFLDKSGKSYPIRSGDAAFFFNFRADRARQISKKTIERAAKENIAFATLTEYDKTFGCEVAFPPRIIETTLAKEISAAGMTQAHIAETEKFPHATYFMNGGVEKPYPGERHLLLESRKDVKTHDQAPEMRAEAIADKAIEEIEAGANFIFINFANPDMVGHTANVAAIVKAVETVDAQLKRVVEALVKRGGVAFVTADHGNAELNIDPATGEKHTAHTINPVPAIITSAAVKFTKRQLAHAPQGVTGGLADIAPTMLALLGIKKPAVMTGANLVS
ncbi:MAG TPA: 2,3-bisphosphoglycerate-independent phosphoglycerate mutase [Candidatus Paceibacterota bacterium]|nr:2,3-bisphosphoglycerate-independent phosphoglycerate mutase [Candidatus Paceibacterota bacterium]